MLDRNLVKIQAMAPKKRTILVLYSWNESDHSGMKNWSSSPERVNAFFSTEFHFLYPIQSPIQDQYGQLRERVKLARISVHCSFSEPWNLFVVVKWWDPWSWWKSKNSGNFCFPSMTQNCFLQQAWINSANLIDSFLELFSLKSW